MRMGHLAINSLVDKSEFQYKYCFDISNERIKSIQEIVREILGTDAFVKYNSIEITVSKSEESKCILKFRIIDSCIVYLINEQSMRLDEIAMKFIKNMGTKKNGRYE